MRSWARSKFELCDFFCRKKITFCAMERFVVTFLLLLNLVGGISSRILMPRSTNEGKLEKEPSSFFFTFVSKHFKGE